MANRKQITFTATAHASGLTTVETPIVLRRSAGTDATTTGSSFVLTSQKTFVITSIVLRVRGAATATAQATTFNFRLNVNGAVTITTTPILFSVRLATPATSLAVDSVVIPFNEPFEIWGDGTTQIGLTAASTYVTNAPTWDVLILGYEL